MDNSLYINDKTDSHNQIVASSELKDSILESFYSTENATRIIMLIKQKFGFEIKPETKNKIIDLYQKGSDADILILDEMFEFYVNSSILRIELYILEKEKDICRRFLHFEKSTLITRNRRSFRNKLRLFFEKYIKQGESTRYVLDLDTNTIIIDDCLDHYSFYEKYMKGNIKSRRYFVVDLDTIDDRLYIFSLEKMINCYVASQEEGKLHNKKMSEFIFPFSLSICSKVKEILDEINRETVDYLDADNKWHIRIVNYHKSYLNL